MLQGQYVIDTCSKDKYVIYTFSKDKYVIDACSKDKYVIYTFSKDKYVIDRCSNDKYVIDVRSWVFTVNDEVFLVSLKTRTNMS